MVAITPGQLIVDNIRSVNNQDDMLHRTNAGFDFNLGDMLVKARAAIAGTGTPYAITSMNVSSIGDYDVGQYRSALTVSMTSSAYAALVATSAEVAVQHTPIFIVEHNAWQFGTYCFDKTYSLNKIDKSEVDHTIYGRLA
jgi:hypothetical protein